MLQHSDFNFKVIDIHLIVLSRGVTQLVLYLEEVKTRGKDTN